MSCDPCGDCTKVSDIQTCNGTLTIGEIAPNTSVKVCVLDLTSERLNTYTISSNDDGLLLLERGFAPNHYYRVWINTTASLSIDLTFKVLTVTLNDHTTVVYCAEFSALAVANQTETNQTLSA